MTIEKYTKITTVAKRLQQLLKETNTSQADIVHATGIDKTKLSHWVKGDFSPRHEGIELLSNYFNVPEPWLMGYNVERNSEIPLIDSKSISSSVMSNDTFGSKNATTSERLSQVIREKELKQIDLVNATGLSKGDISHYLKGDYEPKSDRIKILARFLDVSEAWLMGFDTPKERSKSQKKKDQIDDLILHLEKDELFLDAVTKLHRLPSTGLEAIITILSLTHVSRD